MPKNLRRFLLFSLAGMIGLGLWATLFGAVSSTFAFAWAVIVSPNWHNNFISMVSSFTFAILSVAMPLGFVLFGSAFWLMPEPKKGARELLRLCVFRSLAGTILLALVSLSISARSISNFSRSGDGIAPPYFINLVAGWLCGYFIGIVWAIVEGIIQCRKAEVGCNLPLTSPPIAHP